MKQAGPVDLKERAHRAMIEQKFSPDFPPEIQAELRHLEVRSDGCLDLRSLLWSSIDNDESRDLDQIEYAERKPDGSIRLLIGIADVDCCVKKGGVIDQHAYENTTSVYTGAATFPMLPEQLATSQTSLLEAEDRLSIVIEMLISPEGEVLKREVYRALARNQAKLTYDEVGEWLLGRTAPPEAITRSKELEAQIRLQLEASTRLIQLRARNGALVFGSYEPKAVVSGGEVVDLKISARNPARDIIESFMVAANVAMAEFIESKNQASIRRVVRTPKRWDRIREIAAGFGKNLPEMPESKALSDFLIWRKQEDPLHFPDLSLSIVKLLGPGEYIMERPGDVDIGHFGLALHDYTHSTAPNRRYADLIIQRIVKALTSNQKTPYTDDQLSEIAAHCTERENAARKVERIMRKVVAAAVLSKDIGKTFDGVITGCSEKGVYVRLLNWPAEGCIVKGKQGCDVGDKVRVKLIGTNIDRGFIDFEKL